MRPGYFDFFRIPLRKGRVIDEHDVASAPWVVVVNESFAKKYFPNDDPLGKQIHLRFNPYPVDEEAHAKSSVSSLMSRTEPLSEATHRIFTSASLQQQAIVPGGAIGTHLGQTVMLKLKSGDQGLEAQVVAAMRESINESIQMSVA